MKTFYFFTFLTCLNSTILSAAPLSNNYKCAIEDRSGNLWVSVFRATTKLYDFRIGAGGAISELRDSQDSDRRLNGPPTPGGPESDRVFQEVFWGTQIFPYPLGPLAPNQRPGAFAINTNQAGLDAISSKQAYVNGNFNPVYSVVASQSQCRIEVKSVWTKQFKARQPGYRNNFLVDIPAKTIISIEGPGIIRVKNIVLIGGLKTKQGGVQFFPGSAEDLPLGPYSQATLLDTGWQEELKGRIRLTSWLPFDKSFSQAAFGLSVDRGIEENNFIPGKDWFVPSSVFTQVFSFSASSRNGYVAFYNPTTHSGVAAIYGKNRPECYLANQPAAECNTQTTGYTVKGMAANGSHPVLVLALNTSDLKVGSLVLKEYALYPFKGLGRRVASLVNEKAGTMPASKIYVEGANLSSELLAIKNDLLLLSNQFKANQNSGSSTYQLGQLLNLEPLSSLATRLSASGPQVIAKQAQHTERSSLFLDAPCWHAPHAAGWRMQEVGEDYAACDDRERICTQLGGTISQRKTISGVTQNFRQCQKKVANVCKIWGQWQPKTRQELSCTRN